MNYFLGPLKKYVDFHTRASRKEYWMFVLITFIISVILSIVTTMLDVAIIYYLFVLAILIPSLAVQARRLHDTNRTGWWILIGLIPVVGWIVLIVFYVFDSTPGDNKYGPNPKGMTSSVPPTSTPPTNPTPAV